MFVLDKGIRIMKNDIKHNKNTSDNSIFEITKAALRDKKIVTKHIRPFGGGHDEHIWKIQGSENISFIFDVNDFGKQVNGLTISIEVKAIPTNKIAEHTLKNKELAKQMYNLFVNKENACKAQSVKKETASFVEQFKTHLK